MLFSDGLSIHAVNLHLNVVEAEKKLDRKASLAAIGLLGDISAPRIDGAGVVHIRGELPLRFLFPTTTIAGHILLARLEHIPYTRSV